MSHVVVPGPGSSEELWRQCVDALLAELASAEKEREQLVADVEALCLQSTQDEPEDDWSALIHSYHTHTEDKMARLVRTVRDLEQRLKREQEASRSLLQQNQQLHEERTERRRQLTRVRSIDVAAADGPPRAGSAEPSVLPPGCEGTAARTKSGESSSSGGGGGGGSDGGGGDEEAARQVQELEAELHKAKEETAETLWQLDRERLRAREATTAKEQLKERCDSLQARLAEVEPLLDDMSKAAVQLEQERSAHLETKEVKDKLTLEHVQLLDKVRQLQADGEELRVQLSNLHDVEAELVDEVTKLRLAKADADLALADQRDHIQANQSLTEQANDLKSKLVQCTEEKVSTLLQLAELKEEKLQWTNCDDGAADGHDGRPRPQLLGKLQMETVTMRETLQSVRRVAKTAHRLRIRLVSFLAPALESSEASASRGPPEAEVATIAREAEALKMALKHRTKAGRSAEDALIDEDRRVGIELAELVLVCCSLLEREEGIPMSMPASPPPPEGAPHA